MLLETFASVAATSGNLFRESGSGGYIFNLATKPLSAGDVVAEGGPRCHPWPISTPTPATRMPPSVTCTSDWGSETFR
jgi:hypothetical protein